MAEIDYLRPDVPLRLPWHRVPRVAATDESLDGYGHLFSDPDAVEVAITRWPAQGWRPVDDGTGDEAGTVTGTFAVEWRGDEFHARNDAVDGTYLLGWSTNPGDASTAEPTVERDRVLMWHANYHPDGGQAFFPLDGDSFVLPLALPGDDVRPEHFVAFVAPAGHGIYIHADVWHEGVFTAADTGRFHDQQGAVHARVSCNIAREHGVFLEIPLA